MDLDLGAVRAFVAVADAQHFGAAADVLGLSQQAVSKRIAKLESDLGAALLHRARGGAEPTAEGTAFLPHARALVGLADRAVRELREHRRPLRVDVLDTRVASIELVRDFHQATGVDIDVVTSIGLRSARTALATGAVDASLARVVGELGGELACAPIHLEPLQVILGRSHRFARRARVRMTELAGSTAWMPGNAEGSEWADFYERLGAEFGIRIDTTGPDFGYEHFVAGLAAGEHIGFAGEQTRLPRHPGVVRVRIAEPVPVYPWSVLWHRGHQHPRLRALITHLTGNYRPFEKDRHWLPAADARAFE